MIEITLTNHEAKRLLKATEGSTDAAVLAVREYLKKYLDTFEARKQKLAPWRKVVKSHIDGIRHWEELECGHRYTLRTSKNWVEDNAKKRRCELCAHEVKLADPTTPSDERAALAAGMPKVTP